MTILARFVAKSGPRNRIGKPSSTACATATAQRPPPGSLRGRVPGQGFPLLSLGTIWLRSRANRSGLCGPREHLPCQAIDLRAGYWKKRQALAEPMRRL